MPSPRRFPPPWSIGERITGDVRLLLAQYAAGRMSAGKCRPRLTLSRNDANILRHGHPVFRHSHQMAAASKRQAPKGSGTRNMPHVASANGELILRKLVMSSGALASGQGRNLNKVLTTSVKNDWRMVNAPPHGKGVSFGTGLRRETRYGPALG
jgi:hypothetical protein